MHSPSPRSRHFVVGTAGHVDHGKTTLTRALTGVDTDRLKEEKERELSIELGFAPLVLPSGRVAGLVDVPGHERFIRHMVAGVSGMDAVILVIAADEGVMPQTREHLDILSLLGIRSGVVALTKADLVEPAWLRLVTHDVQAFLSGTALAGAPVVACSGATGEGLQELLLHLDVLLDDCPDQDTEAPFKMPIDRVFVMRGFGTVVTGTVDRGAVAVDEEVEIQPSGSRTRVRGIQVHGHEQGAALAGQRAALNLAGVAKAEVSRGEVVCQSGSLRPTSMLDVELTVLPTAQRGLSEWERVRVHTGTAELIARVALLGDLEEAAPGTIAFAQLRLESPTAVSRGDRFVIRTYSPAITVAGGRVLDPNPRKHRGAARREAVVTLGTLAAGEPAEMLREALQAAGEKALTVPDLLAAARLYDGPESREALGALVRAGLAAELPGGLVTTSAAIEAAAQALLATLEEYHRRHPLREGMDRADLRAALRAHDAPIFRAALSRCLDAETIAAVGADAIRLSGHEVRLEGSDAEAAGLLEDAVRQADVLGLGNTELADIGAREDLLALLVGRGILARVGDRLLHTEVLRRAREAIERHFRANDTLKVSELRDLLGSSRKAIVPLLEYFDAIGVTERRGDVRVPGGRDRSQ